MKSNKLNIIRTISLFILLINAIILGCKIFFEIPFPDAIIRISGVLTLIAIPIITYTTVKILQSAKKTEK